MMKLILGLYCCISLVGCSTMMNGVNKEVKVVNSDMAGLSVIIEYDGVKTSEEIPSTFTLFPDKERQSISIAISDGCYEEKTHKIQSQLAISYWLNVLNIIGFFVDYATGAMWQLPEYVILPVNRLENCVN